VTRRGPVFVGSLDTQASGIFLATRGGAVPAVLTGDLVRGTGRRTLAAVDDLLTRGDTFLLRGALTTVDGPGGVFLSRGRRLSKVFLRSEEHTSELQSRFDLVCRL